MALISDELMGSLLPQFQAQGTRLGVVGWVQNTDTGTVQGQLQGPLSRVQEMQEWLKNKGSPKSRITEARFQNQKEIQQVEYQDFYIKK